MDRTEIERHLADARGSEAKGASCIERQRALLDRCETDGLDLATARQFLTILMAAQKLHVADRQWLERKLAASRDANKRLLRLPLLRRLS